MCGIIGISCSHNKHLANGLYEGAQALAHRGADGAGIVLSQGENWFISKTTGPASSLSPLKPERTEDTQSPASAGAAIGHVRYATHGGVLPSLVQPYVTDRRTALAFNGHLRTADQSDSQWLATELTNRIDALLGQDKRALKWLADIGQEMEGAAAGVCLTGGGVLIFRDKTGIRPLVIGVAKEKGACVIAASETIAIYAAAKAMGLKSDDMHIYEVAPGTCFFAKDGELVLLSECSNEIRNEAAVGLCAMEPIYMSDPNSQFASATINEWRRETGRLLAQKVQVQADIVVGVPSSGISAAVGLGEALKLPVVEGLTKRKRARSFLQSTASKRRRCADEKFIIHSKQLAGKRILLVDDSLVRGTTMKSLVDRVRNAGAVEIHAVIASPPVRGVCSKGIDLKSKQELFARVVSEEKRAKVIGADSLIYADEEMINRLENPMCMKCFRA